MGENFYAIAYCVPDCSSVVSGKPYPISKDDIQRRAFNFYNENGILEIAKQDGSAHLEGGDWHIVKESDLTPEQRRMAGLPTEDATIAELRERIEALEARVPVEEEAEPEWPQTGDTVWLITGNGEASPVLWSSDWYRQAHFLGVYRTREEAEQMASDVRQYVDWKGGRA